MQNNKMNSQKRAIESEAKKMNVLATVISATVIFAVPLLLVALGGMFSERSGVINIEIGRAHV